MSSAEETKLTKPVWQYEENLLKNRIELKALNNLNHMTIDHEIY